MHTCFVYIYIYIYILIQNTVIIDGYGWVCHMVQHVALQATAKYADGQASCSQQTIPGALWPKLFSFIYNPYPQQLEFSRSHAWNYTRMQYLRISGSFHKPDLRISGCHLCHLRLEYQTLSYAMVKSAHHLQMVISNKPLQRSLRLGVSTTTNFGLNMFGLRVKMMV